MPSASTVLASSNWSAPASTGKQGATTWIGPNRPPSESLSSSSDRFHSVPM
jgi:hypothetical protein